MQVRMQRSAKGYRDPEKGGKSMAPGGVEAGAGNSNKFPDRVNNENGPTESKWQRGLQQSAAVL